jgi:transposase-like protein
MQASVLEAGLSVRRAAVEMGVHRTTAFRWRHRILTQASSTRAGALNGAAEADETYMLRSYKGQPCRLRAEQSRAPRRRGGRAPPSAVCQMNRCLFWCYVTVRVKSATSCSSAPTRNILRLCLHKAWPTMQSCVAIPVPLWQRRPAPARWNINRSIPRPVSVGVDRGTSRTSMPTTAVTNTGCAGSTESRPRTWRTVSAGFVLWIDMPKADPSPLRCWLWPWEFE